MVTKHNIWLFYGRDRHGLFKSDYLSGECQETGGKMCRREGSPKTALGGWIRPVSARPTSEVSAEERQYERGAEPAILDIIGIPLRAPAPNNPQTENHIIDANSHWRKLGQFAWENLPPLSDTPPSLWANVSYSFPVL